MARITAYSACPKCGENNVLQAKYQPPFAYCGRTSPERMQWTCGMCGYSFIALCADAKEDAA